MAPEAQPAALLLVDVLHASRLAGVEPSAQQQGQVPGPDFQEMQQIVCSLSFDDSLNKAQTGQDSML